MFVRGGAKMGKTRNDQQWQRIFNGEGIFNICCVLCCSQFQFVFTFQINLFLENLTL